jgi:Response regulators consisting of a CheY-like receiver domain and a winged-helix DNA-binding domain
MAIAQGGDDYVEKPFRLELLKAKVEAILRRTYQYKVKEQVFLGQGLFFDQGQLALYQNGEEILLTKLERRVMARLAADRPDVVSREELMMDLWDTEEYVSDGTLTTVISRLRSKLKNACGSEVIRTKKGQGYSLS